MRLSGLRAMLLVTAGLLALGGCVGDLGDSRGVGPGGWNGGPEPIPATTQPVQAAMRRLTAVQYDATMRALFGDDVQVDAELEADTPVNGFVAIGSARTTISPRAAELYESAALRIAESELTDPARRGDVVPCTPSGTVDSACAREFVETFGRRAWRRPLAVDEVTRYVAIADQSATVLGDFYEGLAMATAGLLQSPNFLFRVEIGEEADGRRRYSSVEMASRLSYLIWNAPPDEALLAAGERGDLVDAELLRAQAERMVAEERSRGALRDFFAELLRLEGLDRLPQDPDEFPAMSATIGAAMRESTLRTIEDHLLVEGGSYRDLFTTRTTFVNPELAALYGVEAPAEGEWARVELPDGPRAGLLGQASVLALFSHSHASSPTLRGKFVRETLLCQSIPPPPADVGELPEPSPELPTMRERLQEHRANPACASCHSITDPIGLALENFDAIGSFREQENGATIDPSGELDGTAFADARELGQAMASHPQLTACLVRNLYRYGTGHVETRGEEPTIRDLADAFAGEPELGALMVELVTSDGFRFAGSAD
ncbi:Cellulose-binding domain protein [Sandaracinus amylolyticus]|uniref:Cellulose-binding domain protein n=2 Tax=Sandaracinus amylolyticus TaxID=927083 RepID=A0A0F6YNK5_9BACT|nr:Cellulose-binding domain protein [Sandaracinus amylolyticus]